jgi:hypothetical protein
MIEIAITLTRRSIRVVIKETKSWPTKNKGKDDILNYLISIYIAVTFIAHSSCYLLLETCFDDDDIVVTVSILY